MTSHERKTPEQATLGKGAPGDPERMEVAAPGPRYLDVPVAVEKTDAETRPILKFGVGIAVAALVAVAATFGVFRGLAALERRNDPPPPPLARGEGRQFPEPRLQTTPLPDLDAIRARRRSCSRARAGWTRPRAPRASPSTTPSRSTRRARPPGAAVPMAARRPPSPSPSPRGLARGRERRR